MQHLLKKKLGFFSFYLFYQHNLKSFEEPFPKAFLELFHQGLHSLSFFRGIALEYPPEANQNQHRIPWTIQK